MASLFAGTGPRQDTGEIRGKRLPRDFFVTGTPPVGEMSPSIDATRSTLASMPALSYTDHRNDPSAWARELGISREAIDIYLASDVIDRLPAARRSRAPIGR